MKIFVDELPTEPRECLFVEWHYDHWGHRRGYCPFDNGNYCVYEFNECEDDIECPYLIKGKVVEE